jgi:actin-like ATPase involved in cell morphogenesis
VQQHTGMSGYTAESPLTCVAVGAGHALEELDRFGRRAAH